VNELGLHNTALLSLVWIENLVNMGAAIRDLILVHRCIAQRHLWNVLTIEKTIIMQYQWCKYKPGLENLGDLGMVYARLIHRKR
jgi:hypothetical protein